MDKPAPDSFAGLPLSDNDMRVHACVTSLLPKGPLGDFGVLETMLVLHSSRFLVGHTMFSANADSCTSYFFLEPIFEAY